MFPIIECGLFQIQTFSVVLLAAFFITILAGVKSQQNDILAVRWLIQKLLIILVAAGICGRLVSVVIMMAQEKLTFAYCFIHGGFVYYGALTGGMTAGALLCIHDRKNILEMTDIALSSLPLGQAIGRLWMLLKWLLLWPGDKQLLFCNVSSQRNAGASISDLVYGVILLFRAVVFFCAYQNAPFG